MAQLRRGLSPPNPNFRDPLFQYGHGTGTPTGCAIVGGAFYNPPVNQFPASYLGKYFFADLCSGWIRVMDPANNTASAFATGLSTPVDLQVGPDGSSLLSRPRQWRPGLEGHRDSIPGVEHLVAFPRGQRRKRHDWRLYHHRHAPKESDRPRDSDRPCSSLVSQTHSPIRASSFAGPPERSSLRTTIGETLRKQRSSNSQLAPTNDLESAIIATLHPAPTLPWCSGSEWRKRRRRCRSLRSRSGGRLEAGQHQHAQLCPDRRQQADRRLHSRRAISAPRK